MKTALRLFAIFALVAGVLAAPPDISGKWKWVFERNGEPIDIEMNLKQQGSKLSGKISAPENRQMDIRDGVVTDEGAISFYINLERDSGPLKIEFTGKADGERITGKTQFTNDQGERREHEWNPKREQARNLTGTWTSTFKRSDGSPLESTLELTQAGSKLTGTQSFNGNETELREGNIQGDQITFQTQREREGRTVTAKYRGKIQKNDSIKGEIESDWTGQLVTLEWEARKTR